MVLQPHRQRGQIVFIAQATPPIDRTADSRGSLPPAGIRPRRARLSPPCGPRGNPLPPGDRACRHRLKILRSSFSRPLPILSARSSAGSRCNSFCAASTRSTHQAMVSGGGRRAAEWVCWSSRPAMAAETFGSPTQPSLFQVFSRETASRGPDSRRPIAWISSADDFSRRNSENPPRSDLPSLRMACTSSATLPLASSSPSSSCFIVSQPPANRSVANCVTESLGEFI